MDRNTAVIYGGLRRGGGRKGINFHKGAKSKGVPVTTEGVSTTGVLFRRNSSPVPSVASVDSIFCIETRENTHEKAT